MFEFHSLRTQENCQTNGLPATELAGTLGALF